MPSSAAAAAAVRSVSDRIARAQRAYAERLREAIESLRPLVEAGNADAATVTQTIEAELSHIKYGSAIVDT
jgi:pantothenate synthetase